MHNWFYSISDRALWINHYGSNTLDTRLPDGSPIKLTQQTKYPWQGDITITLDQAPDPECAIMLRIPGWTTQHHLKINGNDTQTAAKPGTYLTLKRKWSPGDTIQLHLPMETRLMHAHPAAANLRDKVAVMRGPSCMEVWIPLAK